MGAGGVEEPWLYRSPLVPSALLCLSLADVGALLLLMKDDVIHSLSPI